jgi:hypothetical protein
LNRQILSLRIGWILKEIAVPKTPDRDSIIWYLIKRFKILRMTIISLMDSSHQPQERKDHKEIYKTSKLLSILRFSRMRRINLLKM